MHRPLPIALGMAALLVVSSLPTPAAAAPYGLYDDLPAHAPTYAAWRVVVPPGGSVTGGVAAAKLGGEMMWATLAIYTPAFVERERAFVGLMAESGTHVHVETAPTGEVLEYHDPVDGSGSSFEWHVDEFLPSGGERIVVVMVAGDGALAANLTLLATPGLVVLGRTSGPAFFAKDADFGAWEGDTSVVLQNPVPLPPDLWMVTAKVAVQENLTLTKPFAHRAFGLFFLGSTSGTAKVSFAGPGGAKATPPFCMSYACNSFLTVPMLAGGGDYKFRIDYRADAGVPFGYGAFAALLGADVEVP